MSQEVDIRSLITEHTRKGKTHLQEAAVGGDKEAFHNAIKEFILAYKNALFLNCDRSAEHSCLFNIGSAYVAAGYFDRGVDVLNSVEKLIKQRGDNVGTSPTQGDIYFNIAFAYDQLKNNDVALNYYEKALNEYNSQASSARLCETLLNMGKVYARQGEPLQARACYAKAASNYIAMNKFTQACDALLTQAELLISTSPVVTFECSEILAQCQKQAIKVDDDVTQANIFYKIALKFTVLADYENALHCFEQAEGLCRNKDKALLANICQNLGVIHNRLEDYLLAVQFHRKAVKVHGELGNRDAQGQCFCNLAFAQVQMQSLDEAEMSYLHAKQAFRDCDNQHGRWHVFESLAGLYLVHRDFPRAIEHYKRAIKCQASSRDAKSESQDRLVDKLVLAINQYHSGQHQQTIESNSGNQAIGNSPNVLQLENKKQPDSTTEVDGPPAPAPAPRRTPAPRKYQAGHRGYRDESGWRPIHQVARGLSTLTVASIPTTSASVRQQDSFGATNSRMSWREPSSDSDSSDDPTFTSSGAILRPTSATLRPTLRSKRDSNRAYDSGYYSVQPHSSMTSQMSVVDGEGYDHVTRPKESPRSSTPAQLHNDSDTPRSQKSDTNYADHYKEQLKGVESKDDRQSSSSSFTSDTTTPELGEFPKSMPRGKAPAPPKPPRSALGETYLPPLTQGETPNGAKKTLRFQETSDDPSNLYASIRDQEQNTTKADERVVNSPEADREALDDQPPTYESGDSLSEFEAPSLSSALQRSPAPINQEVTPNREVSNGRDPNDTLPGIPQNQKKNQRSKACIVM